jgi:hypothetical protein
MAFKIWVTPAITFTKCSYASADGAGDVTVSMVSSEILDTDVSFDWVWTGDLSSTISGTTTISSGNSYGSATVGGAGSGEIVSTLNIDNPNPGSYNLQVYSNNYGDCY